jgi:transposase
MCMVQKLAVRTERVDDVPVLLAQMERMGIAELLDEQFRPHGNWQGTSLGWTAVIWLAHILSEGDHRLSWAQSWVASCLQTLCICTGQSVRDQELSDDRLGLVLDALSCTEPWQRFETALNRRLFRVYNLNPQRVRVDSTTASGYWSVTEEGLFQFGHSKDHRPDLPQLKVMLSTLDPLGMPVATQVVAGERADDPLYIPAIQQVQESLDEHGLLYVGDCKMAAIETRTFIQAHQDYYLCPLSKKQMPDEVLVGYLEPVWSGERMTTPIYREDESGQPQQIAEGYEQSLELTGDVAGQAITWTERHLIVRSLQHARASEAALRTRLNQAQADLAQLNERKRGKKRIGSVEEMQAAAEAILHHQRVTGLLKLTLAERVTERPVRAYGGRPASVRVERVVSLQTEVNEQAVEAACRWFGWRVYATNHPEETLPLEKAILAYREEYLVERGFGRLKGKPLSLTPMYVQSDARASGLIRLLSVGLRVLTLIEFRVRQRLAEHKEKLAGLYAGNPKRATRRPTAEAMLQAFKHIDLSVIAIEEQVYRHLTPLSEVQKRILSLLDLSPSIYDSLVVESPKPP